MLRDESGLLARHTASALRALADRIESGQVALTYVVYGFDDPAVPTILGPERFDRSERLELVYERV